MGTLRLFGLTASVCAISAGACAQAVFAQEPSILVPGEPVRRALVPGSVHVYTVELTAGDLLRATVVREDLVVEVTVRGPGGVVLRDGRLSDFHRAVEPVSAIAETSGPHLLEVRAAEPHAPEGHYVLEAAAPRKPTPEDRERWAAERTHREGKRHQETQAAEGYRKALGSFGIARAAWRRLGETALEAEALVETAGAHRRLGEYREAVAAAQEALTLFEQAGDRSQLARTHRLLGELHYYLSDLGAAMESLGRSLEIRRERRDLWGQAEVLSDMSVVHSDQGETRRAVELAREALELWRAMRHRQGEVSSLGAMGYAHFQLAEYQQALDWFTEALPLKRALGDREGEAATLVNIGGLYQKLGDPARALEYFGQALSIWRDIGQRKGEASTLNNMGVAYDDLQQTDKAIEHYRRALALRVEIGDRRGEAGNLVNLGYTQFGRGETSEAIAHATRALAVLEAVEERAIRANALALLGRALAAKGEAAAARERIDAALALRRETGDRLGEAGALHQLAGLARDGGDLDEARRLSEAAVAIVESYRTTLRSEALRASFTASVRQMYELYIDVLLRLHEREPWAGFGAEALRASERARARGLLELIATMGADIRRGADPVLLQTERRLQERLALLLDRQMRLLSGRHTPERAATAAREIEAVAAEYEQIRGRLRASSPRYAALTQPEAARVAEIQGRLLDAETLLLEYALGDEGSVVWAVTPSTVSIHRLPRRAEIEAAARAAHERLSTRPRTAAEERALDEALAALARMVLGPVASDLGERRLVVVPDGALHYVPFGALPDPGGRGRPLIADHEVVALPSASVLVAMREELGHRTPATKAVAVLADPVFDRGDERVRGGGTPPAKVVRAGVLGRALRDAGLGEGGLRRLPFTRREARAIASLVAPGQRREALDFEASRDTATHADLGDYRLVHFATHGFFNGSHPELSGLVLSLVDREGRDQEGFLSAADVFNLRLGADVVVLSGCRTGLGKEVKGEGLIGMTRAFMYAGAPRVLASLWPVDDAATAELMAGFYGGILKDGLRPAAALRRAQTALAGSRARRSPYFWAAFQLYREWR